MFEDQPSCMGKNDFICVMFDSIRIRVGLICTKDFLRIELILKGFMYIMIFENMSMFM